MAESEVLTFRGELRIAAYAIAKQSKPRINQKKWQIIAIEVTRSDFVVDKKNCETVIIDVAVPADFSVIDKEIWEKIPNFCHRNLPLAAVPVSGMFLNQLQTVAWKRKSPGRENRLVVSFLTQITILATMWRFWLRLKVTESVAHLLLFCVSAGTKLLQNGSPKKRVRFLLWAEVHNLRSRYENNNCNYCKSSRCYLCWLQNRGDCPWPLTILIAAYLIANQQEIFKSLGAIWLAVVSRKLYILNLYTVSWLAKAKWERSSLMIAD